MATQKKTAKKSRKKGVPAAAMAGGVAAAAAAAGAAYYFYGAKHAKQHRSKAMKWANAMKRDVLREAKKLQKLDDAVMHDIVDRVAGTYKGGEAAAADIRAAASELKDNWRKVQAEARKGSSTVRKTAKKAAGRARKVAKKRGR